MKMISFFIFTFLTFTGCEKNNTIEVIPSYDSIYLTNDNVDKPPYLVEGNENKLLTDLSNDLKKSSKENSSIEYKLLLNETGKVDKIMVVESPDEKYTNLIRTEVSSWKFNPAIKNGIPVKSQYRLEVNNLKEAPVNDSEFVAEADVMPQIIGGIYELQKNIKYPEKARKTGIEGKVFVKVFVDEHGNVAGTKIMKSAGEDFDEAAMTAIQKLKFTPGMVKGKAVKIILVIPIQFKLS
jgi:TonB family protein